MHRGELGFQGSACGRRESVGSIHHEIDRHALSSESEGRALALKFRNRLIDRVDRAWPHPAASIEHAIDGGQAHLGLLGDVLQGEWVGHG